jgi:hypothetical protein
MTNTTMDTMDRSVKKVYSPNKTENYEVHDITIDKDFIRSKFKTPVNRRQLPIK